MPNTTAELPQLLQQIEQLRREMEADGRTPYALILGTEPYEALNEEARELTRAEVIVHDSFIGAINQGEIVWWDRHDYETAEDAWMDMHGY